MNTPFALEREKISDSLTASVSNFFTEGKTYLKRFQNSIEKC